MRKKTGINVICQNCDAIVTRKGAFNISQRNGNSIYNCVNCVPFEFLKAKLARKQNVILVL